MGPVGLLRMLDEGFHILVVHHEEIRMKCAQSLILVSLEFAGYRLKVLLFC